MFALREAGGGFVFRRARNFYTSTLKKAGKMKKMDADMPLFLGAPHAFHPLVHPDCLFLTCAVRQG